MSGFHLVPVTGGEPVHLPPGETVLGRGPLLGVSLASFQNIYLQYIHVFFMRALVF